MTHLVNVHPADELAALREEIKQLSAREDELRALLLKPDADLNGDQYIAHIQTSTRESVDKSALIAELGREAVERFFRNTVVRSVKVAPKPE